MSSEQRTISLFPPTLKGRAHELIVSEDHECPYCHGNGWLWGRGKDWEGVKVTCPVCQGVGRMKAIVEITWLPDMKQASDRIDGDRHDRPDR